MLLIDAPDEAAAPGEGIAEWLTSCPPLPGNLRIVASAREAEALRTLRIRKSGQLRELRLDTRPRRRG